MLAYIDEHGIGNVVVLFLDRFGRNPMEILRRYWDLQERGITVQSVNEDLLRKSCCCYCGRVSLVKRSGSTLP